MKYVLMHTGKNKEKWSFELEVGTVFCNHPDCHIKSVDLGIIDTDKVILSLTSIPKRIDVETQLPNAPYPIVSAWVLGDEDAELLEAPFKAGKRSTSKTVFER